MQIQKKKVNNLFITFLTPEEGKYFSSREWQAERTWKNTTRKINQSQHAFCPRYNTT